MGAGVHGGFGHTKGAPKYKHFTVVRYEGSVIIGGVERDVSRKVYQRHDIDFGYHDPDTGKTNHQLMKEGRAPIGNDGKPIELHHVIQKESGPIVEVREVTHREYRRILHGLVGRGGSFRNDPVLNKQFNSFRSHYWKWRAKQYEKEGR